MKRLSSLKKEETGVIMDVEECEAKIKLMEMGCIPGEKVKLTHVAPFGDPIAIEVAGYILSMRKAEAYHIVLEQ